MKKLFCFIMIFCLNIFYSLADASINFDTSTNEKTTLELQLKNLDEPYNIKNINDSSPFTSNKSKRLYLSRLEDDITVDANGKVTAFLIIEMTQVNGIHNFNLVLAKGQTDALIIVVKKNGFSAYHAVAEAKPAVLDSQAQAEQDALQSKLQQMGIEVFSRTDKSSPEYKQLQADYNKTMTDFSALVQKNFSKMKVRYEWKATGPEIDMNNAEEKWIRNRAKILPDALAEAQATVDLRKKLKAKLTLSK